MALVVGGATSVDTLSPDTHFARAHICLTHLPTHTSSCTHKMKVIYTAAVENVQEYFRSDAMSLETLKRLVEQSIIVNLQQASILTSFGMLFVIINSKQDPSEESANTFILAGKEDAYFYVLLEGSVEVCCLVPAFVCVLLHSAFSRGSPRMK